MKRLRHILQSKHLIKIITIIIFIITLLYTNYYPFKSKYIKDDKEFIGIVTKYEVKEDKMPIEIKAKEKLFITYKYLPVKIPIKILSIIKNISIIKKYTI